MELDVFEWSEDYKIGNEAIDNEHKQLFRIVNRIINIFMENDFNKNKAACIEAIKYIKSYTIRHFAEEEEYQRSIGYSGYKMHKKVHDNMRDIVIPSLEKEIISKSYSKEAMEHFVGACAGWLAAHVLVEDMAIVGKAKSKWVYNPDESSSERLDNIVRTYIKELFRINANLLNGKYAGYKLGELFCRCDAFTAADGTVYTAVTAMEQCLLEVIMRKMVDPRVLEMEDIILPLVTEMLKTFNFEITAAFLNDVPANTSGGMMKGPDFYKIFETAYPDYSMIWRTNHGYVAFCLKKGQL